MTIVIGIFDEERNLEEAVEQLAGAGFETAVLDENIVGQELSEVGGAHPVLAPGSAPEIVLGSDAPNILPKPDRHTLVRAFQERLADHDLTDEEIDAYAAVFRHGGRFVVVEGDAERAQEASGILQRAGASKVNRHD